MVRRGRIRLCLCLCCGDVLTICVSFVFDLCYDGRPDMARMQLIAGLVSAGLSILATLLAVDEIEVQVRRREAEPM